MPRRHYRGGLGYPRAVAWLGFRSSWGQLWHLGASAVATADIDARGWMLPEAPEELTARVATLLGGEGTGESLAQRLGRDVTTTSEER